MSQLIPPLNCPIGELESLFCFLNIAQIEPLNPVMMHSWTDILGSFAQPGCIDRWIFVSNVTAAVLSV